MFEGAIILLKLVSLIANYLNARHHFTAGQKDQIVKSLNDVAKAAGLAGEIRSEVEEMSDDELDEELMS